MKSFFLVWIFTLLLKIALAAFVPLTADESYYWMWSHHIQLSYFDHPPFVAWLFFLGHWLEPFANLIRLPTVVIGHLTYLVWYLILKPRFAWKEYKLWYFLALTSPLVGLGSIIGTPDVPLLFFWSLSIYFFQRALNEQKAMQYFLLGATLGLGFCSKYHIVLFVPLILLFLYWHGLFKKVSKKNISLTLISGMIFSLPVILWNFQNDFASFRFQIDHGFGSPTWSPEWTYGYTLGEILLLFPFVVFAALKARETEEYKFLHFLAWGPLVFFFISSFRGNVELNWPNIAFPSVFALVLFSKYSKQVTYSASVFWIMFYLVGFGSASLLPKGNPIAKPFREPFRFRSLANVQTQFHPLYAGTYQIASTIWYENKVPIYKLRGMSRYDFYDTLPQSLPHEDTFYVIQENWTSLPDWLIKKGYKTSSVREIEPHFVVMKVSKE